VTDVKGQLESNALRFVAPGLMAVAACVLLFVFWPQVSALFAALDDLEEAKVDSISNKSSIAQITVDNLGRDASIKAMSESLERLIKSIDQVQSGEIAFEKRVDNTLANFEKSIAVIQDNVGDLSVRLDSNDAFTGANTDWRDDQEKRAAVRVDDQGERQIALEALTSLVDDIRTEELPDFRLKFELLKQSYDTHSHDLE